MAGIHAARGSSRVALISCGEFPQLDEDDRLLIAPLAERGVRAEPVVWDAPGTDWTDYRLAVLRSTWDYAPRRDEFVDWAATVPNLANPADVVRWNTDKRYLDTLSAAGAPTVPTTWVEPGDSTWRPPDHGEYVIKPAVSAGSRDTGRYDLADSDHRRLAAEHVRRLAGAGRLTMVQPYLAAVDTVGETALLYFAGPAGLELSHAIRKGPLLTGPDLGVDGLFRPETIEPRTPSLEEAAIARKVLALLPHGYADRLLYARVDLIPGPDGRPVLVELELTEPSLFLAHGRDAPARLADAIVARLA
ncbi:ATP-grasp domain-containing protein [Micromonospora zhanjiangensis]|uniref:RimK family alpha-L-glutamate ligase n=1 Tax=Micromonospora zhanjiangensis TaxID=1522057 RepID=A0ABV8KKW4_9ACTN